MPATDRLVISGQPSGSTISVVDVSGREVLPARTITSGQSVELDRLPAGTYRAVLRSSGRVEMRTFIVLR
ncbi:MAG: T9SS type A sorting domain-containing protein [Flavobacteriales bacterium]|nr:T9SS type A sorting domain-containing protein [Flavobacteriales bacterium]